MSSELGGYSFAMLLVYLIFGLGVGFVKGVEKVRQTFSQQGPSFIGEAWKSFKEKTCVQIDFK